MPLFSLLFLAGDFCINSLNYLPNNSTWLLVIVIVVSILAIKARSGWIVISLAGLACGLVWTSWYASRALSWHIPTELEGKPVEVIGTISSIPIPGKYGFNFLFTVDQIVRQQQASTVSRSIKLGWNTSQKIYVGDRYRFFVRMKRIHALRNPGTFNYEAWALQNNIRATGSVITSRQQQYLGHEYRYPIAQFRQYLHDLLMQHLPQSDTSSWLLALSLGERYAASRKHWQILRATGTNHLMAIAGLHIGLISGFIHLIVAYVWRRTLYLCYLIPAQLVAASCALFAAWAYSALAGFALPTQRACVMLSLFIAGKLARKSISSWHIWSLALFFVLVVNPLSVLSESFWLSFFTIALIIYGMHSRIKPNGLWWKWFRVQWVIGIGLLPLSLLFFQQTSVIGVLANSVAIPWLGFTILPLCLSGSLLLLVSPDVAQYVLLVADKCLTVLWWLLSCFADLSIAVWTQPITSVLVLTTITIACLLFLAPVGMPGRLLGCFWLLPMFFYRSPSPPAGGFWLNMLDVGQGLSVVIQTSQHALIYDTGAKFSDRFDMGENVVVPFIRSSGIGKIDMLVVSHGDNDHAGGMSAILNALPVTSIKTSATKKIYQPQVSACLGGDTWVWDGVKFSFIYPDMAELNLGNDGSCVLRVDNGKTSVLLTGDIEKFAEKKILVRNGNVKADIVTAPHHGSKTSGFNKFISEMNPLYVLVSAGYRNRYRLPHKSVIKKYHKQGVLVLNTVGSGAIQFKIDPLSALLVPDQYRTSHRHYWDYF
jgi:competence protein ComEC